MHGPETHVDADGNGTSAVELTGATAVAVGDHKHELDAGVNEAEHIEISTCSQVAAKRRLALCHAKVDACHYVETATGHRDVEREAAAKLKGAVEIPGTIGADRC